MSANLRILLFVCGLVAASGCQFKPPIEKSALTENGASLSAQIQILDDGGAPVANAQVSGAWSGAISGTGSGTTDSNGVATIIALESSASGAYTFTVQNVTLAGAVYDSAQNNVSSGSYVR